MKNIGCLFVLLWLLVSCQGDGVYVPQDLRQLSNDEIIQKVRNYELPDFKVVFRDQRGHIISGDSLSRLMSTHLLFSDTYVNEQGEVVEIVVRDNQPLDSALLKKLTEAYALGPEVTPANVDCGILRTIIHQLEESDQAMRTGTGGMDPKEDLKNLSIAMGIIEQCGMPSSNTHLGIKLDGLWLVFQHAPHKYRKAYFHYFEEAAEKGDIRMSQIALMKDRILMMDKEPQLYGSQVRGGPDGYTLWDLAEPEYVDQRRAKMGLGPLKAYLAHWDIAFDVPQKQK